MAHEALLLAALVALAGIIALPAVMAVRQRRVSSEASEIANALVSFAVTVRCTARCQPLDATLQRRAQRLRIPELAPLLLALELPHASPQVLADTAQRLALRLKRRVAFERKMLARTAPGRRRGAVAASVAPLAFVALRGAGMEPPFAMFVFLLLVEACGCWMLWRLARVEI